MRFFMKKLSFLVERRKRKQLICIFLMMVVGAFLEVIGVSLMIPLITAVMQPDIIETNAYVHAVCAVLDLHSHRTFVIACIAALVLLFAFKDLFLMALYYLSAHFVYNNRFAMQKKLLHIYLTKPYEYYLTASSGEILRVIQNDVSNAYGLLDSLLACASETVVTVTLIVTIFIIDPVMTSVIAGSLALIILIIQKMIRPVLRRAGLDFQRSSALSNKWLLQAINGIKDVKVMQKEAYFESSYNIYGQRTVNAEKKNRVAGNIPRLLIEMVCVCSTLIVIAVMIFCGRDINTLIPALAAFAMAAVKLMPSANRIVGALNAISYLGPAVDRLVEQLITLENMQFEDKTKSLGQPLKLEREVTVENLTYKYPSGTSPVLSSACMVVPVGKSVGIVGKSGAGKTTAVDIMLGLLRPDDGRILADGRDIMDNYSGWLSVLGYIPQTIYMLDDTIRANIAFGVPADEVVDEKVWHALKEAQMYDFVKGLPQQLDTSIGERGVRLSGGQRQRLGIARVLYNDPQLLIFDEATSALDNETEAAIMDSINHLHGKKTMIIIAHRLQTIEGCDMVYRVKDGVIVRER